MTGCTFRQQKFGKDKMPFVTNRPYNTPPPLGAPLTWDTFVRNPSNETRGASGVLGDGRNIFVSRGDTKLLDVDTLTWSSGPVAPLSSHRKRGVVPPDGNLYTGMGNASADFKFHRYNYLTDDWTELTPFPIIASRIMEYTIAYGGSSNDIYLFGGYVDANALNTIYKYDITLDTWSLMSATLPVAMSSHDATRLPDGRIFVGNAVGTQKCVIYDPDGDSITNIADFPELTDVSEGFCTLLQNGNPYITCTNAGSVTNLAYEYIVNTNTWIQRANMPQTSSWGSFTFVEAQPDGRIVFATGNGSYISTSSV
jgi:hypothetical protein